MAPADRPSAEVPAAGGSAAASLPATIVELLAREVAARGSDPWLIEPDRGDRVTSVAQLVDDLARAATVLHAAGVGPGAPLALSSGNRYEFVLAWLAATWLGAPFVPLNTALKAREATFILADSGAVAWVVDPEQEAAVQAARDVGTSVPTLRSTRTLDELVAKAAGATPRDAHPGDPAAPVGLLYTSGTTGNPKGCLCPHAYYLSTGLRYGGLIELGQGDVLSTSLPLFHMNAQTCSVLPSLVYGVPLVLQERFHASTFFNQLRAAEATIFNYIGAIPAILYSRDPSPADRGHRLRLGWGGGIPRDIHAAFEERFGVVCVEGFGMTETGATMAVPIQGERRIGTGACGTPYAGLEAKVVGDDGNEAPRGTPGELVVRGSGIFSGYHGLPREEAFDGDGWFHTGDTLRQEKDGFFYYVGRKKDMIRRAGENVAPGEIEGVLLEHDAVAEAAVIGTPDRFKGEAIVAFVRLEEGFEDSAALREELIAHAAERLAYFKVPSRVEPVADFPRTPTQRVQKFRLRELLADETGAEAAPAG